MLENATVPFTIIKENNTGTFGTHKWTKTLPCQENLNYLIENITILQEPIETLNMNITLSHEMKSDCNINSFYYCNDCGEENYTPQRNCQNKKGNIFYDLRIDFHNYLHEFSSSYSYEVVCKISHANKPDEYLFMCVEPRLEKVIVFKKCYASMACNDTFNFSSTTLYFGIRRLNNGEREINMSALLNVIASFQSIDDKDGSKVIVQARDGQITAHKFILSQYSDVFRAMFTHEMREKQDGIVDLSDVGVEIVKKMVDYLYTGKLGNIIGMTEELFKVAHRYQIHELCRRCEEYYIFNVQPNNDNIVKMLQLVDLYELKELKNSAEKFVRRHEQALVTLPLYRTYLCESINIAKAVVTLILADKYHMNDVKTSALDFIKANYKNMVNSDDFLKLFESNPRLMKEVYVFSFQENI